MKKKGTEATLVFLRRENEVLLAMKRRSYGKGKWNGIGGKIDDGETVEEAAIRETQEEIEVTPKNLGKVAILSFDIKQNDGSLKPEMYVHVYSTTEWEGEPTKTEEMEPQWFNLDEIPYDQMWPDDQYWLPGMLDGKMQRGHFIFNEDYEIIDHTLERVTDLKNR